MLGTGGLESVALSNTIRKIAQAVLSNPNFSGDIHSNLHTGDGIAKRAFCDAKKMNFLL